jgi:hypothetical protein
MKKVSKKLRTAIERIVKGVCPEATIKQLDAYPGQAFDVYLLVKYPSHYLESQMVTLDDALSARIYELEQREHCSILLDSMTLTTAEQELFKYIYTHHPEIKVRQLRPDLLYTHIKGVEVASSYGEKPNVALIEGAAETQAIFHQLAADVPVSFSR